MLMQTDQMPRIIERWRQRQDMVRARLRLELQGQSMCRRVCDGDKTAGAKMWFAAIKDADHDMRPAIEPILAAMAPLLESQKWIEKDIKASVKQLPLWNNWAVNVKGLGEVSFGGILGECGTMPGDFRNPSCLWKRLGLAVIDNERQRRVAGSAALLHGYSPMRRSLMWNVGNGIIKAQVRNPKGEDGKPLGDAVGIGPLGALYLERKALETERNQRGEFAEAAARAVKARKAEGKAPLPENVAGRLIPIHIHNRAKRYMEKRLLREMWQQSRV